jgi:hypothetical protein
VRQRWKTIVPNDDPISMTGRARFDGKPRTQDRETRGSKCEGEEDTESRGAFHNCHTYLHQACQVALPPLFLFESELLSKPPTGDDTREQRSTEQV